MLIGAQINKLNAEAQKIKEDTKGSALDNKIKAIDETWLPKKYKNEVDKLIEETKGLSKENALKEISLGLQKNGIFTPVVATAIGTLTGWDMTKEGILDEEVGDFGELAKLFPEGTTWEGKVTKRDVLNTGISLAIAGKMLWSKIDNIFGMFNFNKLNNRKQTGNYTFEWGN